MGLITGLSTDKPAYLSLSNQGSVTGVVGAILLTVGESLAKGVVPNTVQLIGYGILFVGVLMYLIGNRRAQGKVISSVANLNSQLEVNRVLLNKNKIALDQLIGNGHDFDDGPTELK